MNKNTWAIVENVSKRCIEARKAGPINWINRLFEGSVITRALWLVRAALLLTLTWFLEEAVLAQNSSVNVNLHSSQVRGEVDRGDAVFGQSKNGHGVRGIGAGFDGACGVFGSSDVGYGVKGASKNPSRAGLLGESDGGKGVQGISKSNSGVSGYSETGAGVMGESARGDGVMGSGNVGVHGVSEQHFGVVGDGFVGVVANGKNIGLQVEGRIGANIHANGGYLISGSRLNGDRYKQVFLVDSEGKVSTGGGDVAERIDTGDVAVYPGDVVEIDANHPGRFRLTAAPGSTAVAGVLSTSPGMLMNAADSEETHDKGEPQLALVGRVPVKVCAENGKIRPGDLLVSSSTPGHAMRAPINPIPGTVIGKALGSLGEGTGLIEMLVMLR